MQVPVSVEVEKIVYINTTIEVEKIVEVGIRLVLFENLHVLVLAMHLKY